MKKVYTIMLALIALCGGFYALIRFAGLEPDEFFPKSAAKEQNYGTASPETLQRLYDSLENINFAIRKETNEKQLKNLKDTQKNLWERVLSARNAISQAEAPKTLKEEEGDLVDSLIKGISITAAILLVIIVFLIIKITRRSREVEKVTERLKTLQTEPAKPPPLGGIDPTMFSTRFRQTSLPQVKPVEQSETNAPKTRDIPVATASSPVPLRKTAKQRVTEAVQRMAEALESLRKYGTVKTQAVGNSDNTTPIATTERLTKTKVRVPSLNSTKISPPPADETTFDRRAREKRKILDWARQGRTPSEIAKWLDLPRDQVETVIRLAREKGES